MRLEPSGDLPALPDNADPSIVGAEEQTVRACAQAGDLIALEELSCFVVGERDLRYVEEVERLPLLREQLGPSDEGGSSPSSTYREGHDEAWVCRTPRGC